MHEFLEIPLNTFKEIPMKKLSCTLLIITLLLISLISCASKAAPSAADTSEDSRLSAIESQLASLLSGMDSLPAESTATPPSSDSSETDTSSDTAQDDTTEGFKYELVGNTATITGYVGSEEHLVIPASIDEYKVTAIGDGAFADTRIKSVIISNGVESIGWFAFDGCTKLSAVTVPSSVKKIGYSAFGSADSALTVYCHESSFAKQYAVSYGLSYAII